MSECLTFYYLGKILKCESLCPCVILLNVKAPVYSPFYHYYSSNLYNTKHPRYQFGDNELESAHMISWVFLFLILRRRRSQGVACISFMFYVQGMVYFLHFFLTKWFFIFIFSSHVCLIFSWKKTSYLPKQVERFGHRRIERFELNGWLEFFKPAGVFRRSLYHMFFLF